MEFVALGNRDADTLTSLAGRLSRLDRKMREGERSELSSLTQGRSTKEIINSLMDAVDPDKRIEKAKEIFKVESPSDDQIKKAPEELVKKACPPFDNPKFKNTLIDIRNRSEQIIDTISQDEVIFVGPVEKQKEKAQAMVDNFRKFIEENKDELTALQIIYRKPYGQRHLTYQEIKELAEAIKKPPYLLTPERLWQAYEQLEKSKVKRGSPQKLLTDIVSLLRFAIGESNNLEPFSETVEERFKTWLSEQDSMGRKFKPEQMEWLRMIKDHIVTSLSIGMDDFELAPFNQKGGAVKVYQLFGKELDEILKDLNERLAA